MRAGSVFVSPMRKHLKYVLLAILGLGWLGTVAPAAVADEAPVLVELFTSQGCSSCPPADKLLGELSQRDDLIALSLHVDYWDYLGWRDTFAQRRFTERQIAYRDAWHENVVYTPQMVIHGLRDVRRLRRDELAAAIAAARETEAPVSVSIERQGGMLKCRIEPGPEHAVGVIWIAKYTLNETVPVGRGENAGRTLTYHNVVTSLNRIGAWAGTATEDVAMPQPEPGEGVAIWLQAGEGGPILTAAKIENPAE